MLVGVSLVVMTTRHISDPYEEGISRSREYHPPGFQSDHVSWRSWSLLTLPCDDWFSKFSAIWTIGVTELSRCLRIKIVKNVWVCEACLR
jgi:hypothetical protein